MGGIYISLNSGKTDQAMHRQNNTPRIPPMKQLAVAVAVAVAIITVPLIAMAEDKQPSVSGVESSITNTEKFRGGRRIAASQYSSRHRPLADHRVLGAPD